jgi:hypothetical protein
MAWPRKKTIIVLGEASCGIHNYQIGSSFLSLLGPNQDNSAFCMLGGLRSVNANVNRKA